MIRLLFRGHLLASVGPSWRAMMWYSSCPLMGSLTTALMLFMGNFSVLSLVPNHSWSSSILNVSLTLILANKIPEMSEIHYLSS